MSADHDDYDFTIDESDPDNLFASPNSSLKTKAASVPKQPPAQQSRGGEARHSTEESREVALQQELENVRNVNRALEGIITSLEKAKSNMGSVSKTVNSASSLLQTWTRILSQTEHNQRLILNPAWRGASQDLVDIENEAVHRQHEAQRRQVEEQQRREAAARKAEEDEKRRAEAATRGVRGSRSRGRLAGRAGASSTTTSSSTSYVGVGGQGGRGAAKGSSSTGSSRGGSVTRGSRGRGRGGAS